MVEPVCKKEWCEVQCYYPVKLYESDIGKRYRKGIKTRNLPTVQEVRCGKCSGCRLEYARQMSIRCIHESMMHEQNCFVTLTYNNENLPVNGSVDKRDIELFIKRLRRHIEPEAVYYYGCAEYGSRLRRPHYHGIFFGYDPPDKKLYKDGSKRTGRFRLQDYDKFSIYTSESLEKIWSKGYCTVGKVTLESAGYVARYVSKKVDGYKGKEYYNGKEPEFSFISKRIPQVDGTRGGIGKSWYLKYKGDVYPKDYFHLDGKRFKPPRYYDKLYLRDCSDNDQCYGTFEDWELIKEKRKEAKLENKLSMDELQLRRKYNKEITKTLIRSYENGKKEGT